MIRSPSTSIALILVLLLFGCATRHDPTVRRPIVRAQPIRAVWADAWGEGLNSVEQCDAFIAFARDAGFNTLVVQVRKVGDALYASDTEPRAIDSSSKERALVDDAFDPLAYITEKAHGYPDMRVEAWMVANRVWVLPDAPPEGQPAHLLVEHPEWALLNEKGAMSLDTPGEKSSIFVDPSDYRAREHVARVAADIVRRYDVDAIHLDYIRYPGNTWGFGERAIARYRNDTGATGVPNAKDEKFVAWRADEVNDEVRQIRSAIKQVRPDIELTASVVAWGTPSQNGYRDTRGYKDACQDWPLWVERRLVDAVYVMHYKREGVAEQAADYRGWLDTFDAMRTPTSARIVIGQGAYLNDIQGSLAQMRDAEAKGFYDFAWFSYRVPTTGKVDRGAVAEALRTGPFAPPTEMHSLTVIADPIQ